MQQCPLAEAVELVARAHQSLIWDRTRQVLRLRSALREFFPADLQAFDDLTAGEALELLDRAPDPDRAVRLPRLTIVAALRRAGRCDLEGRATTIQQTLKADQLRQPRPGQTAYAAIECVVRMVGAKMQYRSRIFCRYGIRNARPSLSTPCRCGDGVDACVRGEEVCE
jgi:hypothetical protein